MTHPEREAVARVAQQLQAQLGPAPHTLVVLGSGLGPVADRVDTRASCSTSELGLPASTVPGHAGRVLVGQLGGGSVVVLSGRVHLYEGLGAQAVVRYVRAMAEWGVQRAVLTCSAGGIAPALVPGSLCLIRDHINLQSDNPARGVSYGDVRFPDLTQAYDPALCDRILASAAAVGLELHQGVYTALDGPCYETPAEIQMVLRMGGDMVGMSTVPEVIAARQIGLPVVAIACVSNRAAGLEGSVLSHDDVTEVAGRAAMGLADALEVFCAP